MSRDTANRQAARSRRATGSVTDFDGRRLSTARRLQRLQRTTLARDTGVSAAAITQFERGQARPTHAVLAQMSLLLGMPSEFFRLGRDFESISPSSAHFRSLRSTPAISREQALAFAEMALAVFTVVEQYVDLPAPNVPILPVGDSPTEEEISSVSATTRREMDLPPGPIPHVVRLLETRGVAVLRLSPQIDYRVDAFSTDAGHRPLVLLSPTKDDRARSRFDAAHELGHLVMHQDVEPGSRVIENQAHRFASEFLAPTVELEADLPRKIDWDQLLQAKMKWGISLAALVYRARSLGLWSDLLYRRANQHLRISGYPEAGPLGPPESPYMLGAAIDLLQSAGTSLADLAQASRLPIAAVEMVVDSGKETRPKLKLQFD